jgi:hypothetical protein
MATSDILPTPEAIWSGRTLTIVLPGVKPRKRKSAVRKRKPAKGKRK